jgi:hypothetical protein
MGHGRLYGGIGRYRYLVAVGLGGPCWWVGGETNGPAIK